MAAPERPKCHLRNHLSVDQQMALEEVIQQHLDEHESVFGFHEHTEVFESDSDRIDEAAEDYVASMHQQLTQTKHLLEVQKLLKE